MVKLKAIFIFLIFILSNNTYSQRSNFGVFAGGSYYIGDLNPNKHFLLTQPAFGALYRYSINSRFDIKANVYYGKIEGDDAISGYNKERNLSFKSELYEFSAQLELNFFPWVFEPFCFTPYIFTGISVFNYNPQGNYNGTWYDLQPLATEGQETKQYESRKKYKLTDYALPFGIGVKYRLTKLIAVGGEWGLRKTMNDYIDDVSTTYVDPTSLPQLSYNISDKSEIKNKINIQRGNPITKDWYSYFGLILTVNIKNKKRTSCSAYKPKRRLSDPNERRREYNIIKIVY